jgi:hypothetical protein
MDSENTTEEQTKDKSRIISKSFPGVLLRILLVLVVGGVIGAVIYFSTAGWVPYLEQRVFGPINNNQQQIQDMAATQQALEDQLAFLLEEFRENQAISHQDLESAFETAEQQADQVQAAVETVSAFSFTQIPMQLATLAAKQISNGNHISALATAQMGYFRNGFETELARIIAHLSRANQYLLHANYGLAEEQLISARQILGDIEEELDSWQRLQALELTSAIEGAITDLPDDPSLASAKLELAWQMAVLGFQALPNQEVERTPSPTPMESITPTPTQN